MALKDNIEFMQLKKKVDNSFKDIMKANKLDSNTKMDEILKLLQIDNTNEEIVFEYLKLQKERLSNSKDDLLKNSLLQYECCVEEKNFNSTFQIKKISYKKRILNLISLIKEYKDKIILNDKIELLEKIKSEKVESFHNLVPINYNVNLELYFYSLYYNFYKKILNLYENNFVNKEKIESYIQKSTIEKSTLLSQNVNSQNNKRIALLDKELEYIPYIYGTFNKTFKNISIFLKLTYDKFYKWFEKKQLDEEKKLLLFTDYLFFLSNYDFEDDAPDYVNIWNDTFEDLIIEEKRQFAKQFQRFSINNNILNVENDINGPYSIKNIDDYSFKPLVNYLSHINYEPDIIELNKFLKIDRYMEKLYIRKIWNHWEQFLLKLFSSNVVKSLFIKLFDNKNKEKKLEPHYFINKNEIKVIINNIRYYIFKSNFHGITMGKNLSVYINGDPHFIQNNALLSKIAYLSNNVQSNLHEIIGHLNIRFQFYLSKDKRYTSPKPAKPSKAAKLREGKESGEFIEQLLFGLPNGNLELEQMLYILDIKNYDKDIDKFKEDFLEYGEEKDYTISPEFKDFLSKLDIDSSEIDLKSKKPLCFIQRYKYGNVNNIYSSHPLDGYDDIYDIIENDLD
jgi:hypothetical protein